MSHPARSNAYPLLFLLTVIVLLAACNTVLPTPTPTWIPSRPGPTAESTQTTVPSAQLGLGPQMVPPQVLDVIPLGPGATWYYDVTLDYAQEGKTVHWTGVVTDTVVAARPVSMAYLYRIETFGHPLRTDESGNRVRYDVAIENRLYQVMGEQDQYAVEIAQGKVQITGGKGGEFEPFIELPLTKGREWGDPQYLKRGDGYYVWRVDGQENVTTPAGTFDNCSRLVYVTNPDETSYWICPQVGIARYEYHHHGSVLNDMWVLRSFIPPSRRVLIPGPQPSPTP